MPIIVDPSIPNPPPPITAESPDHRLFASSSGDPGTGVYLFADFSALGQIIDEVRFIRLPDQGVASGDTATAVGGQAEAFDHETPLGIPATWRAYPIFPDGTIGDPTGDVSLTLAEPDGDYNTWLKSVRNPAASLRVFITKDQLPTFTYTARNNLSQVQGSSYPAGASDLHLRPAPTLSCYTDPWISREQMEAVLMSGPVLFQTRAEFHLADFYAVVDDFDMALTGAGVASDARLWSIGLTEIARPSPVGAGLSIPGRNYSDLEHGMTYDQLAMIFPTYADLGQPQ